MREGRLPSTVSTVLSLSVDVSLARIAAERLGEVLDPDEVAVSAFEVAEGDWRVEIYFSAAPDEEGVRALVSSVLGVDVLAGSFGELPARDWVAASLEGLAPVRAGRIVVHGFHDRRALRAGDIGIEIEAALAFGTGHHGTTRGCLLVLADARREGPLGDVLDVGTGTGVLAIAAAKLGARRVVAGDIDAVAVEVARDNARLNGVRRIRFYAAPGVRHAAAGGGRRGFDVVLANILQRPLLRLAPALAGRVARGGRLILSGLLVRDVPAILSAYRGVGFALERRRVLEGWATLTLRRGGAAPSAISPSHRKGAPIR